MTNLEALQAMTEYNNDTLLEKILKDHGINSGGQYESERVIDLCAADLYSILALHPDLKEGAFSVKFDAKELHRMRREILLKYNIDATRADRLPLW